jgi:hypothetical protein
MDVPVQWREYRCEEYFRDGWSERGYFHESSQNLVIVGGTRRSLVCRNVVRVVHNKPLVPTRTGEAPLLAAHRRRWMTMQRIVAIGLVLWIAGSSATVKAEDGFIAFQAYYPVQRSMLSYHVPEAFSKALNSSREWSALWRAIASSNAVDDEESGRTRKAPAIDFGKYTLLVVASGARPSGGYSVALQSVWESESHVEVVALELRPLGRECTAIAVVTYPVAFALIPRTSKSVKFTIRHADLTCGS